MASSLRPKLTYANVMVTILAFVVLGGSAYAAGHLGKNSVGTKQLRKNAVTAAKIRTGAVNGAKVADGSLTGADVQDGSLSGPDVQDGSLTGADVQDGSLTGADVGNNRLGGAQIDESSLGKVPLAANADTAAEATNSGSLGSLPASSYQRGCTTGTVSGYALINGDAAAFPTTYTTSTTFIPQGFDCVGSTPSVRRAALGDFVVCFPNAFPGVLLTSPINSVAAGQDNIISWGRVSDPNCAGGAAAEIKVLDNDGTTFEDQRFSVLLLK